MSRSIYFAATLALVLSCSPKRTGPGDDDDGNGSNGSNGLNGSACASDMVTAQAIPLDIYIELDQSGSMDDKPNNPTKWQSVTSALESFVQQPAADGMSVGLGYFAMPAPSLSCPSLSCTTDADCGQAACGPCQVLIPNEPGACSGAFGQLGGGDSCNAADYATPSVEIAPLPGVASAITASIGMHSPSTNTPTVQALQGALQHATGWATQHAGDAVVVVLATDGEPSDDCMPEDVPSVESVAMMGKNGSPSIRTFVIGVGDDLSDLNGIAAAGGTGSAYVVDTSSNASQQFLDALNAIRHSVLGCTYQIPLPSNGDMPDFQAVNVVYTPGNGGSPETFPYVGSQAQCPATGNAWYYDNPTNPTQIILCSATCSTVEADTAGSVAIALGCATVIQ